MCIIFPKYLWLATGGSNNIADKYFTPLKGKKIILFPDFSIDNSVFNKWNQKALELQKFGFYITTSALIENIATENDKQKGLDIADFFLLPSFSRRGGARPKEDAGVVVHKTSIIHKNIESESKNSLPLISPLWGNRRFNVVKCCKAEGAIFPLGKPAYRQVWPACRKAGCLLKEQQS